MLILLTDILLLGTGITLPVGIQQEAAGLCITHHVWFTQCFLVRLNTYYLGSFILTVTFYFSFLASFSVKSVAHTLPPLVQKYHLLPLPSDRQGLGPWTFTC